MYYYEVTIYLAGTMNSTTFKIDENEIHSFIKFITDHVDKLFAFNVIRKTISYDPKSWDSISVS